MQPPLSRVYSTLTFRELPLLLLIYYEIINHFIRSRLLELFEASVVGNFVNPTYADPTMMSPTMPGVGNPTVHRSESSLPQLLFTHGIVSSSYLQTPKLLPTTQGRGQKMICIHPFGQHWERTLAFLAMIFGVEEFVLYTHDSAVPFSSVMGSVDSGMSLLILPSDSLLNIR